MFDGLQVLSVGILICPDPIHPNIVLIQQRLHWLGFVEKATVIRIRCEIEIATDISLLNLGNVALNIPNIQAELLCYLIPKQECLREVEPGLKEIDRKLRF